MNLKNLQSGNYGKINFRKYYRKSCEIFSLSKSSGNKIFQTYHLKKYQEFCQIGLRNFKYVVEFGGGYGNMALTFKEE